MIHVPPSDLHRHWQYVKEGLKKVKQKSYSNWIPEDVYSALRNGTSTLHLFNGGFLVLTPQNDFDGVTLFVWIAYGEGDVWKKHAPEVEQMAKNMNAKRIRFHSSRDGWGRRYKKVASIYEKELP